MKETLDKVKYFYKIFKKSINYPGLLTVEKRNDCIEIYRIDKLFKELLLLLKKEVEDRTFVQSSASSVKEVKVVIDDRSIAKTNIANLSKSLLDLELPNRIEFLIIRSGLVTELMILKKVIK